jgi:acetyltransferase-like isoleucine patch superfamily enzyme
MEMKRKRASKKTLSTKSYIIEKGAFVFGATRIGRGTRVHIGAIIGSPISGRATPNAAQIGRDCVVGSYTLIEEGVKISDKVQVWHHTILRTGTEVGSGSKIGSFTLVGKDCSIGRSVNVQSRTILSGKTKLEDLVFVGPGACTYNDKYPIWSLQRPYGESIMEGPIVSRGAVIGGGALLLPGVRIGTGAIIGAGAVVTKDVRSFSVVAGNPAREIKPSRQVELLLEEAKTKLA